MNIMLTDNGKYIANTFTKKKKDKAEGVTKAKGIAENICESPVFRIVNISGARPNEGIYICTRCKVKWHIDDHQKLPHCPFCSCNTFIKDEC
jgi:DNA-directed RNA polymerase subunit RPC12/RpoP